MPSAPLPRTTPSAQGVDARGVVAFVDALERVPRLEPHSLMVLRHGHVVAEGWWAPYAPDRLHLLYSLSKTFTACALGLAVAEGRLGLDDTVISHFPELDGEITDPRTRRIRVRHLAAMASGHRVEQLDAALATDPKNLVRGFLLNPPDAEPGTVFAYSQPCTYTLAAILGRLTGESLTGYLRPRLLDPLGIGPVAWVRDASGQELGYSGLHATTEDIARIGQLHLQRGSWEGRQLLPASWVEQATSRQVDNTGVMDNPDWQRGYGFQFWMQRHGYRGDGAFGQFCLVLPEQDAVVALTAAAEDMQAVLDAAWAHLVPALGGRTEPQRPAEGVAGDAGADADAALVARLTGLVLPRAAGGARPPAATAEAWGRFVGRSPQTPLTVAVHGAGDAWHVRVDTPDADGTPLSLDLPLSLDGWQEAAPPTGPDGVPLPLATSAAWADEDTLRVDVVLVETPHRLLLTCHLAAGTVTMEWHTTPLWNGPLHEQRAPLA